MFCSLLFCSFVTVRSCAHLRAHEQPLSQGHKSPSYKRSAPTSQVEALLKSPALVSCTPSSPLT
jgi:hypothetical protein